VAAGSGGGFWTQSDWNRRRGRQFRAAAQAAGIANLTPYALRHSFGSLLIREGISIVEVA
jgi:site-specific recombinase XerD